MIYHCGGIATSGDGGDRSNSGSGISIIDSCGSCGIVPIVSDRCW